MVSEDQTTVERTQFTRQAFARWVNRKLRTTQYNVKELEQDFSDGLKLIKLLEVLSNKEITEFNKEPASRFQKLDNVAIALKFLETEGVSIINICPADIVDSNIKLILALVWRLIVSYSLLGMQEGRDEWNKMPPNKRLLTWIQTKVPGLKINNLSSDLASGKAIAALVNALEPRACGNWKDWSDEKSDTQVHEAMIAANKWLSIQNLVPPNGVAFQTIDEKSMITYLSQFLEAKTATNEPSNRSPIKIYNLEKTVSVNNEHKFCVRIEDFCLRWSTITCTILNMATNKRIYPTIELNRYEIIFVAYTPIEIGPYSVHIESDGYMWDGTFDAVDIISLSQISDAEKAACADNTWESDIFMWGSGITQSFVRAFEPTHFRIHSKKPQQLNVSINIERGALEYSPLVTKEKDGTYTVNYVPPESGTEISIQIELNGKLFLGSPDYITVAPAVMERKMEWNTLPEMSASRAASFFDMIYVFGIPVPFLTQPLISAQVISPSDKIHDVPFAHSADSTVQVKYQPEERGQHQLVVKYNNAPVKGTPFKFQARGKNEKGPYAYGLGLSYAVAGTAAHFFLENFSPDGLHIEISGTNIASANTHFVDSSTLCYSYWANSSGKCKITIKFFDTHVVGSPFQVQIEPYRLLPFQSFLNFSQGKYMCAAPGSEQANDFVLN